MWRGKWFPSWSFPLNAKCEKLIAFAARHFMGFKRRLRFSAPTRVTYFWSTSTCNQKWKNLPSNAQIAIWMQSPYLPYLLELKKYLMASFWAFLSAPFCSSVDCHLAIRTACKAQSKWNPDTFVPRYNWRPSFIHATKAKLWCLLLCRLTHKQILLFPVPFPFYLCSCFAFYRLPLKWPYFNWGSYIFTAWHFVYLSRHSGRRVYF